MIGLEDEITGVMVQYYKSCKRELWFFAHNINLNYEDENIKIGKQIQNDSYSRKKKEINLGPVNIDVTIEKDGKICIYEVKKSSKLVEPAKYQLYYYLWFLKKRDVDANGYLTYPSEKKKEEVKLSEDIINELEMIVEGIKNIISKDSPPSPEEKPYCENCSYYEFCWIGVHNEKE